MNLYDISLKALSPEDKKSVGADIMAVEMSWPIGYPMVSKLDVFFSRAISAAENKPTI